MIMKRRWVIWWLIINNEAKIIKEIKGAEWYFVLIKIGLFEGGGRIAQGYYA